MNSHQRKPILAALLSFLLPGLGQLYCGRLARALAFAAIGSAALLLLGTFIHSGNLIGSIWIEILTGTAVSGVAIVDAWFVAKNAPEDYQPDERNRPATYFWFIALALGCSLAIGILEARRIQDHIRSFRMVGNSMNPALQKGDFIFVDHDPYLETDPEPGDLVIYRSPENRAQHWTSRVVALGEQTVEIRDGQLLIDGESVAAGNGAEKLADRTFQVLGMDQVKNFPPVTVPKHQVFLMCDNRNNALDSRKFGTVSVSSIEGKLADRFFPRSRMGPLNE